MNPEHISTPYPYISLQDLDPVIKTLAPNMSTDQTSEIENELHEIQVKFAPNLATFYKVNANQLSEQLEQRISHELLRDDRKVGIVNLDKEIAKSIDSEDIFRLNVSRSSDNKLVARIGTAKSPDEQISELANWAQNADYSEILFVDDVLAFGDTIPILVQQLKNRLPDLPIRLLVGIAASGGKWNGIQNVEQKTDIIPEYLMRVEASPAIENVTTGMAIPTSRDLTLLGGKVGVGPSDEPVALPYFLPFSQPLRSLIATEQDVPSSRAILAFNDEMFRKIEKNNGTTLTIGDLALKGFGTPYTSLDNYRDKLRIPAREMNVRDYIAHAASILE